MSVCYASQNAFRHWYRRDKRLFNLQSTRSLDEARTAAPTTRRAASDSIVPARFSSKGFTGEHSPNMLSTPEIPVELGRPSAVSPAHRTARPTSPASLITAELTDIDEQLPYTVADLPASPSPISINALGRTPTIHSRRDTPYNSDSNSSPTEYSFNEP